MKYLFIVIGLMLILGGINAVRSPRPWIAPMGGNRYSSTTTYTEMSKDTGTRMGYGAIGLGVAALWVGVKCRDLKVPPPK